MKNQQFQLEEMSTSLPMTQDCIGDIRNIIVLARKSVVRHINSTMILSLIHFSCANTRNSASI